MSGRLIETRLSSAPSGGTISVAPLDARPRAFRPPKLRRARCNAATLRVDDEGEPSGSSGGATTSPRVVRSGGSRWTGDELVCAAVLVDQETAPFGRLVAMSGGSGPAELLVAACPPTGAPSVSGASKTVGSVASPDRSLRLRRRYKTKPPAARPASSSSEISTAAVALPPPSCAGVRAAALDGNVAFSVALGSRGGQGGEGGEGGGDGGGVDGGVGRMGGLGGWGGGGGRGGGHGGGGGGRDGGGGGETGGGGGVGGGGDGVGGGGEGGGGIGAGGGAGSGGEKVQPGVTTTPGRHAVAVPS